MKKLTLTSVLTIAIIITAFLPRQASAQTPQAFKYQAVVRDNAGGIISNQTVSFRFGIRDGSAGGTVVYQETHSVTCNEFGLANLEIGNGNPLSNLFEDIDWSSGTKFLETELDQTGGTNYVSMGTTQLMSVPYALHSKTSDDSFWEKTDNFIHTLNNSVGIGTTSPATKLDVNGTITANAFIGDGSALTGISTDNDWLISGINMYNGNTGNVGIGTTNPNAKLDVRSLTSTTGIYTSSYGGWSLWASAFGTGSVGVMVESANGTAVEAVVSGIGTAKLCSTADDAAGYFNGNLFVENGDVGIGTTNPDAKLHIRNQTSTTGIYTESVEGWALRAVGYDAGSQGVRAISLEGTAVYAETPGGYIAKLCSTEDNAAGYFDGNLFVMNGNVGIGTTNPTAQLDVRISGTQNAIFAETEEGKAIEAFSYSSNAVSVSAISLFGTGVFAESAEGTAVIAKTYGITAKLCSAEDNAAGYFDGNLFVLDGDVGIGTTSPATILSNSSTLASDGTKSTSTNGINWQIEDGGYALGIENTYGAGSGLLVDAGNNGGTGATVAHFVSNDASLMIIAENGNVGIGTASPSQRFTVYNGSTTGTYTTSGWQHSSDERLKTNIAQINNSLDKVMDMEGVYFDWKNKDEKHQVGLIAQDMEKVLPEVVNIDDQGFYSVSYGGVVPVLIEAIKEQQAIINSMQNQNEDLKTRLDKLEKKIQQ